MKTSKDILKKTQCFKHSFGVIHIENWFDGKPMLVLTESSFYDTGEGWGYTYYKCGTIETMEQAQKIKTELNEKFNLPLFMDGEASQDFIGSLRAEYPMLNEYFKEPATT